MTLRGLVVARKTFREFSSLKLLLGFFVPYTGVTALAAQGLVGSTGAPVSRLPLRAQEQLLTEAFSQLAFVWAAGAPMMALVAVLVANGIAKDEQRGTLRILLSKPVGRREVLLGKFAAVVLFGFLSMLAGLLIAGASLYALSGASALALPGSVLALLPATLLYALFVTLFVAAVGTFLAVLTGSRLKTVLVTLVVPALFVAFLFVRVLTDGTGTYETYRLYFIDVNYHLGNAFVLLHTALGVDFTPITQSQLGLTTGVYDASGWRPDPLVGGFSGTVPVVAHVPMAVSPLGFAVVSAALLGLSIRRFDRKDIS